MPRLLVPFAAALALLTPPTTARLDAQGTGGAPAAATRAATDSWRRANERRILDEAFTLFAMPNLASDSVAIRKVADHLVRSFTQRGFRSELLESPTGGPPAVFAERLAPGATRTIVLYAHYDGQPTAGAPWDGDPFAPALRRMENGVGGTAVPLPAAGDTIDPELRIYARSASDDKGPIVAMLAAFDALAARQQQPAVNVKVFLEGEEEAGSQHLGDLLRAHRDKLAADAWFFMDGPVHVSGAPQVVLGVRGVVGVEVTLFGPNRPLHSGHYGNWAPNPAVAAAHLIASMRDRDGSITIADFHDDVRAATLDELTAARALSATDDSVRRSLGLTRTEAGGAALGERIMRPALNVRGIRAGGTGTTATNAMPTSAMVSIDFRLVPDQAPDRLRRVVDAHIRAQGYDVITDPAELAAPHRSRARGPRAVGRRLPQRAHRLRRARRGGAADGGGRRVRHAHRSSHPRSAARCRSSTSPTCSTRRCITLPTVNADNNQHAPNENLRVQNLWDAIALVAALVTELPAAWDAPRVVP